ncbi:aerobic coproporphyrinogen-III oxidase [Perilla frutescens var. hirtella]|uniref:Aerobic coproporphyrinogen-III oxidase n=1 Tax=Perilla frutescens var. hirtella TaxID=608512 RepID=A0AAD4ITJ2_PERFH|nr:aerobic coproporphyrinogen-III oxidase [Perilla frutescens var. hirtella]
MGVSVPILAISISLHLIAFVLAVGAERRRSTASVKPDEYDEKTYCAYDTDASTVYGLAAFGLLLIAQALIHGVTKCLCFGRGMMGGSSTTRAVVFFIFSWVTFLAAEACLVAGSARNAYHTKYRAVFKLEHLSCASLRKGVFAAGAALTLIAMVASTLYYWMHAKADTGGWEKHQNEGVGMTPSDYAENQHQMKTSEFEKV